MKTAVITGASSGLGREFVRQFYSVFPEIERVWLIARRTDRLQELAEQLEEKGISTLTLPLDLCDTMSFTAYQEHLVEEQPEIALLVNSAGCGYLGNIGEIDTVSQTRMIDLNLRALTAITNLSVPYMEAGSRILNVSSIASFCPTPRMTVYSATKAYVSAYTIGAAEVEIPAVAEQVLGVGAHTAIGKGDVLIAQCDAALVGDEAAGDGVEQGGFARAVGAHDGGKVPGFHVQADTVQGHFFIDRAGVESLVQIVQLKHFHLTFPPCR